MAKFSCLKFKGTEDYLKYLVTVKAGIKGSWIKLDHNSIQFLPKRGGNLQWWISTKTAVVNGYWHPDDMARLIEAVPTLHPDWRRLNQKRLKALADSKKNQDNVETLPPTDGVQGEPIVNH